MWLPFVGERSWVIITKDKRNRYNELEREALRRHRVREFFFASGNMTGAEMANALCGALAEMRRIVRESSAPLVASISRSGIVTVLLDEKGSTHERRKVKATQVGDST